MIIAVLMVAAIQTTTTCNQFGGQTTCRTTAPSPGFSAFSQARDAATERNSYSQPAPIVTGAQCSPFDMLLSGCQISAARQAQRNAEAEQARQQDAEALRERVTALLAADDCPGAIKTALDGGDMTLAREAREFCRP